MHGQRGIVSIPAHSEGEAFSSFFLSFSFFTGMGIFSLTYMKDTPLSSG